jgi:hypothetical protein
MSTIHKTIDEISLIQANRAKRQIQFYQSVRNQLTSDQKAYFDRYYGGCGYGRGRGFGSWGGYGRGRGVAGCPGFGIRMGTRFGRGAGRAGFGQGMGYGRGQGRYWDNF